MQAGFTLLELMTALTVGAILVGLAVPAFNNIMRTNQIAAQSNEVISALALARSEAIKRGVRVSVCPVDKPNDPAPECKANWNTGWIMFADDFGAAGTLDPSDTVIQVFPGVDNGVDLAGPAAVTFSRIGRAEFPENFVVTKTGCGKDQRRQVSVGMSGRVSLQRSDCT